MPGIYLLASAHAFQSQAASVPWWQTWYGGLLIIILAVVLIWLLMLWNARQPAEYEIHGAEHPAGAHSSEDQGVEHGVGAHVEPASITIAEAHGAEHVVETHGVPIVPESLATIKLEEPIYVEEAPAPAVEAIAETEPAEAPLEVKGEPLGEIPAEALIEPEITPPVAIATEVAEATPLPDTANVVEEATVQAATAPEVAPVTVPPPAPPPSDDLRLIEGIGNRTAGVLRSKGITSFAKLAETDVDTLNQILAEARIRMVDPSSWPEQARLATNGEMEALEALKARLAAGQ